MRGCEDIQEQLVIGNELRPHRKFAFQFEHTANSACRRFARTFGTTNTHATTSIQPHRATCPA